MAFQIGQIMLTKTPLPRQHRHAQTVLHSCQLTSTVVHCLINIQHLYAQLEHSAIVIV